jgi:[ribosomal protein S5]-alanine N-acetyltransferase
MKDPAEINPNQERSGEYFLKTARLGFRCWSLDDLPLALAVWGNPETTRLIGGPFSREAIVERLRKEVASMSDYKIQYWPMFLLRTSEHVGCGGLRPYKPADRVYELGFHLLPAFWGQGLAVEAGRGVIAYAFESLGVKALFAGHHPANAASRRVLEELGFTFTHEELYPPTGLLHPSYLLTRPERASPG